MELKLKMTLLSDTIFGSGISIPGGEDSSVLCDKNGFPYYKGGSFKGVFREEMENYFLWKKMKNEKTAEEVDSEDKKNAEEKAASESIKMIVEKLGQAGYEIADSKLRFSDFTISDAVKQKVLEEGCKPEEVLDAVAYLRTFTGLNEEGVASEGSLRNYRCVKKGICFYGMLVCDEKDEVWVKDVLGLIKWIGTMRNRGFGKVKIEVINGRNL